MNRRAKSNSIRIISGKWRGRKLDVLNADGLRPTTDRVRETLFNWLMFEVQGARCLDLFAGSGALGIEALSRGAEFVQFVEADQAVATAIRDKLRLLQVASAQANVATKSAQQFLQETHTEPFDVVFLDPPFSVTILPQIINHLSNSNWLSSAALVYVEQPSSDSAVDVPNNWTLHRQGKAGQSAYRLYSLNNT